VSLVRLPPTPVDPKGSASAGSKLDDPHAELARHHAALDEVPYLWNRL